MRNIRLRNLLPWQQGFNQDCYSKWGRRMINKHSDSPFIAPLIVSAVVFVIALFPMPYGFYSILRIIITVICVYGATLFYRRHPSLFWTMVTLALLYNPVFPIHLYEKAFWIAINLLTFGIFVFAHHRITKTQSHK